MSAPKTWVGLSGGSGASPGDSGSVAGDMTWDGWQGVDASW